MDDLQSHIDAMNKKYGDMSVMRLSDAPTNHDVISTGSLDLDEATGIGGIPRGHFTEIFGSESSGKTSLAYHICANAQRLGCVHYIDSEQSFDVDYAEACGFDEKKAIFSQPEDAEGALGLMLDSVSSELFSLVVIDSIAAMSPRAELDGEIGDSQVGLLPRLMSKMLRMSAAPAKQTNTAVVFINQVREKIGVMFGNPETTPGGRALKFHASIRLRTRIKERNDEGIRTAIVVEKNKMAPPYKKAEIEILFGKGINRNTDALSWGVRAGLIEKKGAWLLWGDQKWHGEDQALAWIESCGIDKFISGLRKAK